MTASCPDERAAQQNQCEDQYGARMAKVSGAYSTSDTDITVTAAATSPGLIFTPRDIVMVPRTLERMYVTAVTATVVSVSRSFAGPAAAALVDGDYLVLVGNANEEFGTMRNANTTVKQEVSNYTQVFKTTLGVSDSLNNTMLYGGKELPYQRSKKLTEHKFDIEDAFWFGSKGLKAAGNSLGNQGHEITSTGGVDEFVNAGNSYIQEQNGYLSAPDLTNWLVNAFTYGNDTKVVMAGNMFVKAVNETARGQIRLSNNETKYGIAISTYETAFGTVKIVRNPRFVGPFADRAYCLDIASSDECIRYRFMANRDTQLKTNVQQPDMDGEVDQYITECGLEFAQAPRHSMIRGVVAA